MCRCVSVCVTRNPAVQRHRDESRGPAPCNWIVGRLPRTLRCVLLLFCFFFFCSFPFYSSWTFFVRFGRPSLRFCFTRRVLHLTGPRLSPEWLSTSIYRELITELLPSFLFLEASRNTPNSYCLQVIGVDFSLDILLIEHHLGSIIDFMRGLFGFIPSFLFVFYWVFASLPLQPLGARFLFFSFFLFY